MSLAAGWMQALGQALLPARCLVCGERGDLGRDLCRDCHAALPWNTSACGRCALPLPVPAPYCGACRHRPPPFDGCQAVFRYDFPLDRLLPRLKFHGDLACGRLLAGLCAGSLAAAPRPQLLLPVPLHAGRLRQRGYDQALELARPLARALDLPLCAERLQRRRATGPQTELGAGARRRNVRDAFQLRPGPLPAHVVVFDDVMTTGATLAECCRLLRRAGVARVEAWAVARAPAPGSD